MASKKIRREIIDKMAALATAAFGLVAALAWNDTVKEIFRVVFGEQTGILPMLSYAVLVTVIAVAATLWIGKLAGKEK